MKTGVQIDGVQLTPLNPLLLALVLEAGFVARCFSGEKEHLKDTMKAAIQFPGYALVDVLQPCVSFNKINTYGWYRKRVYFPETGDRRPVNGVTGLLWGFFMKSPAPLSNHNLRLLKAHLSSTDSSHHP